MNFDLDLQLDNDDDSSGEEISKILKEAESKLNETLKITQKPSTSIKASTQKAEVKTANNIHINAAPSDAPVAIEEKVAEPVEELQTILKNVNLDEYKNDQGTDIDSLMRTLLISGDTDVSGVAAIEAAEKKNLTLVKQSKEILKTIEERRRKKELNSNILTLNFLEQISDQLKNNKMKRAAGIPTCMVVNKLIAVGTSLGFVLLFDHFQNLQMILGTREGVEYGTVTSMDISHEGERLAVGHQRGQIVYWDLIKKKSLKAITGIHKTPVIHVRFVNDNGAVLSADSSGVIYFTIFRKVAVVGYIVADPVLVLGGAGGVIKDLKILPKSSGDNKINNYKLAAFCTGDIVTIVSCMNGGVKIARQIQGPEGSTKSDTPLIAWKKFSQKTKLRKHDKDKVKPATDPILAVAWNTTLRLLQISLKPKLSENPMLDLEITNLIDHPMGFQIKAME